jgi:ABC-type lipoprotein release transport system permease subunit
MRLLVGFSIFASVLALVGIYGVVSLAVNSRKRELAIRMAVGAQRANRAFPGACGRLTADHLGGGHWDRHGDRALTPAENFSLRNESTDPMTFTIVAMLFVGMALLACLLPASRATRVDPMTARRYE